MKNNPLSDDITVCMYVCVCLRAQGGRHVVDLLDYYIAGRPVLLFCFLELVALSYVYGFDQLLDQLETMTGRRPGPRLAAHLSVLYGTVAPLLVGVSPASYPV